MTNGFALAGLLGALAGCSQPGTSTQASPFNPGYMQANVVAGRTTEADVMGMFGQPYARNAFPSSNEEVWTYIQTNQQAPSMLGSLGGLLNSGQQVASGFGGYGASSGLYRANSTLGSLGSMGGSLTGGSQYGAVARPKVYIKFSKATGLVEGWNSVVN